MCPNNRAPSNIVNGSPSKELFITMLTRDISLIDAISDLVDNCVDGAIKLRGRDRFTGLKVDITLKEDCFVIIDNCSGIDKDLARDYAFRFGRPLEATQIEYSVGQFGIGMKRALFKMGKKFEIRSVSEKASFSIDIDVAKWSKEESWNFKFKQLIEKRFPLTERGTEITVSSLNKDVKERFKQSNFLSELKQKLELQHLINISKGLTITINSNVLEANQLKLLSNFEFRSAYWSKLYKAHGNTEVEIYAGIGHQKLEMGGWYIFCNNRLIQGPEQTSISGWGTKTPVRIPEYHSQFARFRGFVFFQSKTPSFLPWNTSKTSVDNDSQLFQSVRYEMIHLMRPIIDFLNAVHDESTDYHRKKLEEKYLQERMDSAPLKNYLKATTSSKFKAPAQKQKAKLTNEVIIKYIREESRVEKLKKFFKVTSPKKVGEKTFDYTYDRECNE